MGYTFIKRLQAGSDWSKLFSKRPKLKPIPNRSGRSRDVSSRLPDQDAIDLILDKISKSGYESLTKEEKQQLFNASKK